MSSPTSPTSPGARGFTVIVTESPWQNKLKEHCRMYRIKTPIWGMMSDKRGGRTAWSSTVTIGTEKFPARYWYDGNYSNNAKEDAAEVALQWLQKLVHASSPYGYN